MRGRERLREETRLLSDILSHARDRGMVGCPECGFEGDEEEADAQPTVAVPRAAGEAVGTGIAFWDELDPQRKRTVLGGAMLGAAAGLALVIWGRRK